MEKPRSMSPRWTTACLIGSILLGTIVIAQESKPEKLSPQQRREVQALVSVYRASKRDAPARADAVDKAIAHGVPATRAILDLISLELQPQLASYRERFYVQALRAAETKAKQANPQEINELRQRVLELSRHAELSKEMIERQSDPAMQRLTALLVLERQTVLDAAPALVKQRESMQELGQHWERCLVALAKQDNDDVPGERVNNPPSFEAYLQQEESLAAQLAVPMAPATRNLLATNARSLAPQLDPEEARCILALNLTRNLLGLPPLAIDLKLAAAARGHSSDMAAGRFFAHESPVPGKASFADRAKLAGTTASAENIAFGVRDGAQANAMWWHSPGHHRNMLGEHTRVGVGRSDRHWTELFGR